MRYEIDIPASKSMSNRLLMLQHVLRQNVEIENISTSTDTQILATALNTIQTQKNATININDCGTAFRFLTAYLCTQKGTWILDGTERLRQRPISDLVDALLSIGADITYINNIGFAPLKINGKKLSFNHIDINAEKSSQFVSALMLILPLFEGKKTITFNHLTYSLQYIQQTSALMQDLGIDIQLADNKIVYKGFYNTSAKKIKVEKDWSSAAYWWGWVTLDQKISILLKDMHKSDYQKDSIIVDIVEQFGTDTRFLPDGILIEKKVSSPVNNFLFDCHNNLDLVPLLAVVCVGTKTNAILSHVGNLQYKESNRIVALQTELHDFASITFNGNDLIINTYKQKFPQQYSFSSHNDHRIAMSLALLKTKIKHLQIDNTECVNKSYPDFFRQLENIEC